MLVQEATAAGFDAYPLGNTVRLLVAAVGMMMTLLCLRVAWLRWRNPLDADLQARSPLALLSYATFAAIPTFMFLGRFDEQPNWWLLAGYALAVGTGLAASFGEVTIQLWKRRPKHRSGRESADSPH